MTDTLWSPVEGRFGRTRDGRKVGPMERHDSRFWVARVDGGTALWELDGRRNSDLSMPSMDLVAEWQDDPAPPQASWDDIKVGDFIHARLRVVNEDCPGSFTVKVVGSRDRGFGLPREAFLGIEPRLPEPLKVGDRVRTIGVSKTRGIGLEPFEILAIDGDVAWLKARNSHRLELALSALVRA